MASLPIILWVAMMAFSYATSSVPLKDYGAEYYQKEEMYKHHRSIEKRSASNTSAITNTGSSASWSKLQISPHELGSMPYDHYGINIYGHSNNALSSVNESSKQFFYAPISQLDHLSAKASYNYVTEQAELQFRIEMWNDQLEENVRKYTEKLVKHPVGLHQVRVLPLERVMLSSRIHSTAYQLNNQWIDYHRHRYMQFAFTCKRLYHCERLGHEIRTDPDHLENNLRLQFSLSSSAHSSERQETTIKIRNIVDGELVSQLNRQFPKAKEVLLTEEDEKRVLSESVTNVIVESFDDTSVVNPNSRRDMHEMLKSLLFTSTTFNSGDSKMWDSVFWKDDYYRPDKSARILNDIYRKLDKQNQEKLATSFNNVNNNMGNSAAIDAMGLVRADIEANVDFSRAGPHAKGLVMDTLEESKDNLQWDGDQFKPKPMNLSKFNLGKLRNNEQSFRDVKMRIHYTTAMLSIRVNIKPPFREEHKSVFLELAEKFEGSISNYTLIKSEASNLLNEIKGEQRKLLQFKNNTEGSISDYKLINSEASNLLNAIKGEQKKLLQLKNNTEGSISDYKLFKSEASNLFNEIKGEQKILLQLKNNTEGLVSELKSITLQNKKMKAAGRIHFSAQSSNHYNQSGSTIPYDSMEGSGGGMNVSSGVFTAPRGGVYVFSFHGMRSNQESGKGDGDCVVRLVKNGSNKMTGFSHLDWVPVVMTTNLKLKQGDNVSVILEQGELYNTKSSRYTVFSGFLLIED